MVANIVRNLPFFVLIPAFVLHKLGVKRGEYGFSGGEWKPAIPFLLIYTAAFLFSGLTAERWLFLLYAVLYSGFQEEFFYRGVIQPLFTAPQRNPFGDSLSVVCSPYFTFPDFVFQVTPCSHALSAWRDSAVWVDAYGVYRTGILWPWVLIHALSNVVGF